MVSKAPKPPAARSKAHLKTARESLKNWRLKTKLSRYTPSSLTTAFLMLDVTLKKLASARNFKTAEDIQMATGWIYAPRHGEEVLQLLANINKADEDQRGCAKRAKAAERKKQTQIRQAEKKRLADEEQEQEKQASKVLNTSQVTSMRKTHATCTPRGSTGCLPGCSVFSLESAVPPPPFASATNDPPPVFEQSVFMVCHLETIKVSLLMSYTVHRQL